MVTNYDLHIGAHVKSKDGKKLGSIQKLIVHHDTSRVDGFLLGKGHFSTNRIVAVGQVETTDADGVVLKLDIHEAEQLPAFIQEQMLRSPGNLTYQGRWGAQATFAGSGEHWVMRAPGGDLSTINSNSLFAPAPIGNIEAQNLDDLPENSVLLSTGTDVVSSDGHKIGHVDDILFDSEGRIVGFLVKEGHLFTHDIQVPMTSVAGISHLHVRLNVTAESAADTSRSVTDD
jgi:uncharacterized protein YrrD